MSDVVKWEEMTPRERDALVAEKVMDEDLLICEHEWVHEVEVEDDGYGGFTGWRCKKCSPAVFRSEPGPAVSTRTPRPFTTDIAAAWGVVEKMNGDGAKWTIESDFEWSAYVEHGTTQHGYAATAPEAICIAALRAVGVEVET